MVEQLELRVREGFCEGISVWVFRFRFELGWSFVGVFKTTDLEFRAVPGGGRGLRLKWCSGSVL